MSRSLPARSNKKKPHSYGGGANKAIASLKKTISCDHDWRVTSVEMMFTQNCMRVSRICERCRCRETEYQSFDLSLQSVGNLGK